MQDKLSTATTPQGQSDRWDTEYAISQDLVSSKTERPATVVRNFVEARGLQGVHKVLEQGFGLGRNLRYLLEQGVEEVWGTEISGKATELAKELLTDLGLGQPEHLLNVSADTKLDLPDNYFDLILEIMVMHALNPEQRMKELAEIKRLLKSGGRVWVHTLAAEDPAAQELISKSPGEESGSYWFEGKGGKVYVEKPFTRQELVDMLAPLKPVSLELVTTNTPFGDKVYTRRYYVGVFEK